MRSRRLFAPTDAQALRNTLANAPDNTTLICYTNNSFQRLPIKRQSPKTLKP